MADPTTSSQIDTMAASLEGTDLQNLFTSIDINK
jgi:hypothetical protein